MKDEYLVNIWLKAMRMCSLPLRRKFINISYALMTIFRKKNCSIDLYFLPSCVTSEKESKVS